MFDWVGVQPRILGLFWVNNKQSSPWHCTLGIQRIYGGTLPSKECLPFLIVSPAQNLNAITRSFFCQFPRISLLLPHSLPVCRAIDVFVDLLRIRRLRHPVTIPVPFSVLTQTIITTRSKNHLLSSAAAIDQASQPKNQRQIRARERHTCSQIVCTSRLPTVFVNRRTDSTGTSKLVPHQSAIAQSCQSWLCSPESS